MPISTFLNGGTATQLRGLQWLAFDDLGQILSSTFTSDSGGGGTAGWATVGTTVACRIDPLGNRLSHPTGGRIDERSTHLVTLTAGAAVLAENRFVITGRGTFEVTATRTRTAGLTQVFEVVEAS
jgi:hypothetical protein